MGFQKGGAALKPCLSIYPSFGCRFGGAFFPGGSGGVFADRRIVFIDHSADRRQFAGKSFFLKQKTKCREEARTNPAAPKIYSAKRF